MGVMKKLSVWKPNKISTQFYPRTFNTTVREVMVYQCEYMVVLVWQCHINVECPVVSGEWY
jgi:hypothetical protein